MCFACKEKGIEEAGRRLPNGIGQTSSKFQAKNDIL